jgi:uncharacterized membrane protein
MSTSRVEAFSDGVFAIAITLLVLEIAVPAATGEDALGKELLHLWPSYVSYGVSFLTVGIMWVNHHAICNHIAVVDRVLLVLNLLLLMCIAFVPFPTGLVAEHLGEPGLRAAALAYGITLTVTAVFFNAMWRYAAHGRRLLRPDADLREVSGISRSYLLGPVMYGGSTLVALASPLASVTLYAVIAAVYMVSASLWGRDEAV